MKISDPPNMVFQWYRQAVWALLLLAPNPASPQSFADSIQLNELQEHLLIINSDREKIETIQQISVAFLRNFQPDSGFYYARQALDLARRYKLPVQMALAHKSIGVSFQQLENDADALVEFKKGFELAQQAQEPFSLAELSYELSECYAQLKMLETAISQQKQTVHIAEKKGVTWILPKTYNSIGLRYMEQFKNDSALNYFNRALRSSISNGNEFILINAYKNIGRIFLRTQKEREGIQFLNKSVKAAQKSEIEYNRNTAAIAHIDLARYHYGKGQFDRGLEHAQQAQDLGERANWIDEILESYWLLYVGSKEMGDDPKALHFLELYLKTYKTVNERLAQVNKLAINARTQLANEKKRSRRMDEQRIQTQTEHRQLLLIAVCVLIVLISIWVWLYFRQVAREMAFQQREAVFQQRLSETEMIALRSQMNPHFVFNCLNSIKSYLLNNDTDNASLYLTKFSRLIRAVLENSKNETINLKNELEALRLYIEMEKMRFGHRFDFQIEVDEQLETEFLEIPPMLIQPYVENAIWHGLMHQSGQGKLHIRISQSCDNLLEVVITDNGIGRKRAAELRSKTATNNKSFGMEITSQRLNIIKQLYQIDAHVDIEDLINPSGTKITITIPI